MIYTDIKNDFKFNNENLQVSPTMVKKCFLELIDGIMHYKKVLAKAEYENTGKPIECCNQEIDRCIFILKNCLNYYDEEKIFAVHEDDYACVAKNQYLPIGNVLAFTPVSSPYSSVIHKLTASLIFGNRFFWKPSKQAMMCSYELYSIIDCTINKNIKNSINLIDIEDSELRNLLEQDFYDCLLFTGSSSVAKTIKSYIGRRKAVFETGSTALCYISDKSNIAIDELVDNVLQAAFSQNGKRCIALKNLFIHEKIYDNFTSLLKSKIENHNKDLYGCVEYHIENSEKTDFISNVRELINCGYEVFAKNKNDFPIILVDKDLKKESIDEFFGPFLCLHRVTSYRDISENYYSVSTLSTSIFSEDKVEIEEFISCCSDCGMVCVNFGPNKRFDSLPFGGFQNENENKESLGSLKSILTKHQIVIEKVGKEFIV